MSKILDINNMLDAAADCELPELNRLLLSLEKEVDSLGDALAAHFDIVYRGSSYEQGFGGMCGSFHPRHVNQECPDVIRTGDPGGDWD